MTVTKTREEVEKLKREWVSDPIWDIEDTEGFEEYREELLEFALKQQEIWEEEAEQKRIEEAEYARSLGVEGLYKLVKKLEKKCDRYEKAIELLSNDKKYEAYRALQGYEVD